MHMRMHVCMHARGAIACAASPRSTARPPLETHGATAECSYTPSSKQRSLARATDTTSAGMPAASSRRTQSSRTSLASQFEFSGGAPAPAAASAKTTATMSEVAPSAAPVP